VATKGTSRGGGARVGLGGGGKRKKSEQVSKRGKNFGKGRCPQRTGRETRGYGGENVYLISGPKRRKSRFSMGGGVGTRQRGNGAKKEISSNGNRKGERSIKGGAFRKTAVERTSHRAGTKRRDDYGSLGNLFREGGELNEKTVTERGVILEKAPLTTQKQKEGAPARKEQRRSLSGRLPRGVCRGKKNSLTSVWSEKGCC